MKIRLLRITTVPLSLVTLLKGQPKFMEQNGFEVLTVSAPGDEVRQLINSGVKHKSVALTRSITPVHDVVAVIQLIFVILRFKPTIVHTHTPKAGIAGMLAAAICRVPIRIHTVAGLPWINRTGIMRWLLIRIEKLTYHCAHRVYPNSTVQMEFLKQVLGFSSAKTKMIGRGSSNGIDVNYFKKDDLLGSYGAETRRKHGIPQGDIVFSFVGRVVRDKGIVELINAFSQPGNSSAWLLIVGDFEPRLDPLPESTLLSLENNPKIIMAGFQSDVRPWLLASDVFVFPSHREGFPNGVMQACCLELPVIATNINGCNEIIENNVSGLLISVGDENELKTAMTKLAGDEDLRISMGKKGREFVARNFSQEYVWGELLREYRELLKGMPSLTPDP